MRSSPLRLFALMTALVTVCLCSPASAAISVWWWGDDAVNQKTIAALTAYTRRYKGTLINATYELEAGYRRLLTDRLRQGRAPDVVQVRGEWLTELEYTDAGEYMFSDLNKYHKALGLDGVDALALNLCTVGGRLVGVPLTLDGRVFLWNKSAFARAALDIPKTYIDLINAGIAFKAFLGDEYYPLSLDATERVALIVFYLQSRYGRDWADVEMKKLCYSPSEIKEGMDMILSLERAHAIPGLGDARESGWAAGKCAGRFAWDSEVTALARLLPQGDEPRVGEYFRDFGAFNGGFCRVSHALAIPNGSMFASDAARIIGYLTTNQDGAAAMGSSRGVPANAAAMEFGAVREQFGALEIEADAVMRSWMRFAVDPWFENSELAGENGVYERVMSALSAGGVSAAEAANRLYEEVSAFIAR